MLRIGRWVWITALLAVGSLWFPAQALADISPTEGQSFSGQVGGFTESCPIDPETHYYLCGDLHPSASIEWGDGATSTATLTKQEVGGKPCIGNYSACSFTVSGTNTYGQYGTYSGTVDWSDSGGPVGHNSGSFGFAADVQDAPISLSNVSISRSGQNATLTGTLTDQNPEANPCSYTVTIDWGDGQSSSGTVTPACQLQSPDHGARAIPSAVATFTIGGTHTYTSEPSTDGSLTVTDAPSETATDSDITIPRPASTTTEAATLISQTTATLNADVNANGGSVQSCYFEWGTGTGYGHQVACSGLTSAQGPQHVTADLTGLTASTTYHFQVVLKTDVGTANGGDLSFQTLAPTSTGAPTVVTGNSNPDDLTSTSAVVQGDVNPNGHTVTSCYFEWGTDNTYGNKAACSPASLSGSSDIPVAAALSNLSPDTVYHYRLVASNGPGATSEGADATFRTLPSCNVQVTFGYVQAQGCLSHNGTQYQSTPGTPVDVDGLIVTPNSGLGTVTIDTSTHQITTSSEANVGAGLITVYQGRFTWTEPDPGNALAVKIASLTPPPGTMVSGIPIDGDMALSFNKQKGADLAGFAWLPFGALLPTWSPPINGAITLHTAPGKALLTDQLTITANNFSLLGVGVKNLKVSYSPSDDSWEGAAEVSLPTPNKLDISADLTFQHGSFQKFSGSVQNLNFPIIGGVDLQQISVVFGVHPTTIGGGLGLSYGPSVSGKALVEVDGGFVYQEATSQAAGFIDVNGSLTLASFKIANAYFDYYTNGEVNFGGQFQLGLPDSSSDDPEHQPIYINAALNGALDGSAFDLDANTTVALNFIDLTVGAEVLLSDKGLAACAKLSAFGFTWSPGFGYTWSDGSLTLMGYGCSVGPWQTLKLGQGSAAAVSQRIHVLSGSSLLELKGATGPPKVRLTGPGGQHATVPAKSVKPLMVHGFMVFQDPAAHITWIAIQHGGGRWRLTRSSRSSAIVKMLDAPILPAPKIHAQVSGQGAKRTLTWNLHKLPGQRVTFWQKGHDLARVIGSTTASHGSLHFTVANGYQRGRTIEAEVTSFGHPRTDFTVARFTAPPPIEPGRPRKLKVTRVGPNTIRVSWLSGGHAQSYAVVVIANGGHMVRFVGASVHTVVMRDVVPIKMATVAVRALLANGVASRPAVVRYPPKHK